jgi:hypothetical protein
MSYTDYIELRLAIAEQAGPRSISDVIDRFTKAAEAWFNRELRCMEQLTVANVTFTAGVGPYPTDYLEVMTLADAYGNPLPVAVRGVAKPFRTGYTAAPSGLYIEGFDGVRELEYYAKIPTLTTGPTATNWLLRKAPGLYHAAVTFEAAKWLKDVELAGAMESIAQSELSSLKWADNRSRYGSSTVTTAGYGP